MPTVHAAAAGGAGAGAGGHTSKFFDLEFRPSARVGSLYHVECTAARNLARSCIKVPHRALACMVQHVSVSGTGQKVAEGGGRAAREH